MVSFNKSKYGDYLILNCQEIMAWFLDKRKENQNYYGRCGKADRFVCQRFDYKKNSFKKMLILKLRIGRVSQFYGRYLISLKKNPIHETRTFIDFVSILREQ